MEGMLGLFSQGRRVPGSPLGCAGEVQVSLPQGGSTARDIDSAGNRCAQNVGTAQGDPVVVASLKALESQLTQFDK
uniref:Uncharacterized protein n=1 Tax=Magallana gigas TaxID=29159 RepID=A0A8W8IEF7_MAGGI